MRISDWSSDVCSSVLDWTLRAATDRLALPAGALHDREKIMIWLQENWIVALVVLIVVIALLWWLAARRRPEEIATPTIEPATPAKPPEPARSAERRGGKECVRTCRSRWSPDHSKK